MQPQKIDRFVLISREGLPVYNYIFEAGEHRIDETLLSSALTAIRSVLSEASQIAGDLKEIKIGQQFIMLKQSGNYTGVLFTLRPTQYLEQMISSLMVGFDIILGEKQALNISDEDHEDLKEFVTTILTYQ